MKVLVVREPDVAMMGVGFDRGGNKSVSPVYPGVDQNAFLNITHVNGALASNMRLGYVVAKDSVTLGLTAAQGSGFAMVKLTPNTFYPPNVWNRPQMGVSINNTLHGTGDFLPDTGIAYMIITPKANVPGTTPCPGAGTTCLGNQTPVQVSLIPGIPGGGLSYSFAPGDSSVPMVPYYVNLRETDTSNTLNELSPVSLNSGVGFFQGFNYLFDFTGGYVGYSAVPGAAGISGFIPLLALQSNVQLEPGFLTNLPVYLVAPTTLQQSGTGVFTSSIMGSGSLALSAGDVFLMAANTYSGGTFVNGGTLTLGPGASLLSGSALTVNGGTFNLNGNSQTLGSLAGSGGTLALGDGTLTLDTTTANTFGSTITGSGGLTLQGSGSLVLAANNSFTGPTVVQGGTLTVNGSIAGGAMVGSGGTLAVNGTVGGGVANNGMLTVNGTVGGDVVNFAALNGSGLIGGSLANLGTVAPGNSIGTVTVTGSYLHAAGAVYQSEINSNGQSDLISVGGSAFLQGGSVFVTALPTGPLSMSSTYTLLSAAGGVAGTFASVNEFYPFLQSNLSYDANNAYLNLQVGGFAAQALNPTQYAVGAVLDANAPTATGDFATVLGTLATATAQQGQAVMTALSGNNYAGFSTSMVQGAQLFMNNFANQTGGGGSPVSNRVALAEACDVACDSTTPPKWGAWGGALGGLGTIGANQPVGTVTYNVGGFAAGLDRLVTDNFRMGITTGYSTGTQWVGGFDGLGRSNTFQVGLYGGFAQDKVYADAVLGYAYTWNQMWRNIAIPGLQPRTALGQTGANQWYGQIETGYRFDLGTNANAFVTPFARLQAYTGTQNAFTETGAQSLNLSVAQQTTNSLRSVIGAQLGGSIDLGWREKLLMQLRLGWSHEYADVGRPVSATLAGAPAMPFTTFGVAPQRDGVVLGLSANTAIAEATSIYLRYEGDISGQDSAHALTAGVRMTW